MKIYYKLLLSVCACMMFSCSNEQDLIFDKSSAERLTEAKKESFDYFCSQPNGWAMEYFPNSSSKGVTFLVQFNKDGSCKIGAKNEYQKTFATETSLFEMIADNGPVLTFNSYNNLLHIYSYPSLPGAAASDGKGLEGDYEFIVLRKETDHCWLKGKKHGAYIRMRPLAVDQDWAAYYDQIDAMNSRLFSTESRFPLLFHQGELVTTAYDGNSGIFNIVRPGEDYEEGLPHPFIVLPEGIRFYADRRDVAGEVYVPNAENVLISSVDNPETDFLTGPKMNAFFTEKITYTWKIDTTAFLQPVKDVLQQLRNKLLTPSIYQGKMRFQSIQFGSATFQGKLSSALTLQFKNGKYDYYLPLKVMLEAVGENQVKISFPDPLDYSSNTIGELFLNAGINEFLLLPPLLSGTYTISSANSFVLKDMLLSGPENIKMIR
ncbi:MAG: DUF4302 domain-containing protein [Bacteroidales bacterium]